MMLDEVQEQASGQEMGEFVHRRDQEPGHRTRIEGRVDEQYCSHRVGRPLFDPSQRTDMRRPTHTRHRVPIGPTSTLNSTCFDQEDRDRCTAGHSLCHASQEQTAQAMTTVCAEDDQIRRPALGLLQNDVADPLRTALQ
jgi:hypothetical protein